MDAHPLTKFRTARQLTSQQLADFLGVTRPTISRWEDGTRKPDVTKLAEIEEKTGIAPADLRPDLSGLLSK